MCAEQCLNAHVVHVRNALRADVYVCAPVCTCSPIVRLGLHASYTFNTYFHACTLKVHVVNPKQQNVFGIANAFLTPTHSLQLDNSMFRIDFNKHSHKNCELNGDTNCAC